VLDWIIQVASKTWATPEIIGDLVLALDGIFGLQASFCSGGADRGRKSKADLNRFVKRAARESREAKKQASAKARQRVYGG